MQGSQPPPGPQRSDMTVREARSCVEIIRAHMDDARLSVLDLHERRGWRALGYANWRECVAAEFGQSQSYLYRLLTAAQVERDLFSPAGETADPKKPPIPEGVLRPLGKITGAGQRQEVWKAAEAVAAPARPTGPLVARIAGLAGRAERGLSADKLADIVRQEEEARKARERARAASAVDVGRQRRITRGIERLRQAHKLFAGLGGECEDGLKIIQEAIAWAQKLD